MRIIAVMLNKLTGGRLSPNAITIISLIAHIGIAGLIANYDYQIAAILLIFFGLFDTLDGELARLQNRTSTYGMLLDSVTDRVKEVLLYIGCAYALVFTDNAIAAVFATAACGAALLVSYMNAWGEAVLTGKNVPHSVNKTFRGGLMSFEVRMFTLVIGLLFNILGLALLIIAVLSAITAYQRFRFIARQARHV